MYTCNNKKQLYTHMYKCNNNKKGQEFERQKGMMYERVWREEREGINDTILL